MSLNQESRLSAAYELRKGNKGRLIARENCSTLKARGDTRKIYRKDTTEN